MADIDTGTDAVLALAHHCVVAACAQPVRTSPDAITMRNADTMLRALASDRDRLARELAAWQSAAERFGSERDALHLQLAESERISAARNKLNGELAMQVEAMREALQGLYDDNVDYLTLNNLGGIDNHWMKAARAALAAPAISICPTCNHTRPTHWAWCTDPLNKPATSTNSASVSSSVVAGTGAQS